MITDLYYAFIVMFLFSLIFFIATILSKKILIRNFHGKELHPYVKKFLRLWGYTDFGGKYLSWAEGPLFTITGVFTSINTGSLWQGIFFGFMIFLITRFLRASCGIIDSILGITKYSNHWASGLMPPQVNLTEIQIEKIKIIIKETLESEINGIRLGKIQGSADNDISGQASGPHDDNSHGKT